jgi:TatD DNase family protein
MFSKMLAIAKELSLPVVIHSRQAESQILRLLKENLPVGAVVHCFSGDEGFMRACLDMGFFISFTCNITYKKADNLRSLIKAMPLERLFLETDAPYLPPEGLRGKRNEPLNVMVLAEEIAKIRGCTVQEIARVTTDNAKRFFNIP